MIFDISRYLFSPLLPLFLLYFSLLLFLAFFILALQLSCHPSAILLDHLSSLLYLFVNPRVA
jgi:hypothetical protein